MAMKLTVQANERRCKVLKDDVHQHCSKPTAIIDSISLSTGMGKTDVFVISTLHQIEPVASQVDALVLCHTRELAYQITQNVEKFSAKELLLQHVKHAKKNVQDNIACAFCSELAQMCNTYGMILSHRACCNKFTCMESYYDKLKEALSHGKWAKRSMGKKAKLHKTEMLDCKKRLSLQGIPQPTKTT
ncbi:hypothetical protein CTI12_AA429290 [Artemisia annua]|uniref:DEAD/DEAH-box helicase domain-containing protein n=1 Tax=Artemisia annua TaxID=35608 RepID=A0A2U1LAU0_ARTAN|nr:hypothetical protein CTI12_AA429290 [Artemisia annua]